MSGNPVSGSLTTGDVRANRIVTVPNLLSVVRLCCLPIYLYLLFGRDSRVAAAILLGCLGATDWVDGYIARRFGQVSELGKVLDPTADRLLFVVGVGGMIVAGGIPRWLAWVVLVRELVVGGGLALATAFGMKRFDVSWYGKAGTFGLMFAFPMFLLASGLHGTAADAWRTAAWLFAVPGLAFSLYAAALYVPLVRTNLRRGRIERTS